MLQPHPENVEIYSDFHEIYDRPYEDYIMYGDGRIVTVWRGIQEKPSTTWPKDKELLKRLFNSDDADMLWLYIEIYRALAQNKQGDNHE